MRSGRHPLEGLAELHRIDDADERRAAWRRGMATLASSVSSQRRTLPLEGLHPEALRDSAELARTTRLLDDVDWLSAPAAAAALYELAAALPPSDAKRDLGRRILSRLRNGDAATFVALATQFALGPSKRALSGTDVRARAALALDLPIGSGTRADALALALISRRELSREWLTVPSQGSLPSRRLAARLLERAAREAAQRAAEGDDSGVRVFETRAVRDAMSRLLADREPLVWRHVASTRGLLSAVAPTLAEEIEAGLDPSLGVTEWRRAAASLSASVAVRGEVAFAACKELLASSLAQRDPGIASAIILGMPRAAENDPELIEDLLEDLVRVGGLEAAEALVELRRERIGQNFGAWAIKRAKTLLLEALDEGTIQDEGQIALHQALIQDLTGADETQRMPTLRDLLGRALDAFAHQSSAEAYAAAQQVMHATEARMGLLERCKLSEPAGRIKAFAALREIDLALLETDALANLLSLGARGDDTKEALAPLASVYQRLFDWFLTHEGPNAGGVVAKGQVTLRMRRVRSMLHLVDIDGVEPDSEQHRERRLLVARVLFGRVASDIASPLHRVLCATSARACDALSREDIADVSDVLIAAGTYLGTPSDLRTMAEASMVPEIKRALHAFAKLDEAVSSSPDTPRGLRGTLDALLAVANELPVATSARVEALRAALLGLERSLSPIASSGSLAECSEQAADTPLAAVEDAVVTLGRLVVGARRRMGDARYEELTSSDGLRQLDLALERKLRGRENETDPRVVLEGLSRSRAGRADVDGILAQVAERLELELPTALARVVMLSLARLVNLPVDGPRTSVTQLAPFAAKDAPLPAWMPPSRTLGGFYVSRRIGTGAGGTVFVARRAEDRHNEKGEQFALKVPDYSAAAARTLSESEFLKLFREEAGALLSLPAHPNIARFVTFDVGAKPKPILVMELVDGPHLERLLEITELTTYDALRLLDGIAAGLEAMHGADVGHLDVKPTNIIVRDADGISGPGTPTDPVLVDFGLAGRKLRPGCGTAEYGAPEIWGLLGEGPHRASPADVYAFACVAFEVLTGRTLFTGANEMALIGKHVSHDGRPDGVSDLGRDRRLAPLADVLSTALRRDPSQRTTIGALRQSLSGLRTSLAPLPWPLAPSA